MKQYRQNRTKQERYQVIHICDWNTDEGNESEVKVKSLSRVQLFATPWTVAYHSPPSMGFSRQEYWSGLPFPSPEDLPNPGIKSGSSHIVGRRFTIWATREIIKEIDPPVIKKNKWINKNEGTDAW